MVFITGDIHGNPKDLVRFSEKHRLTEDDVIIILGDVGVNYFLNAIDENVKREMASVKPTFFCIHGNHEERPHNIKSYKTKEYHGAPVWYEEEFPNILFAKDGEIYDFEGKKCLVIGGAYSVDKYWRYYKFLLNDGLMLPSHSVLSSLINAVDGVDLEPEEKKELDEALNNTEANFGWFKEEQPSDKIKAYVEKQIEKSNRKVDYIFSHTCPKKYIPTEMFLKGLNQNLIDNSTEVWLDTIEDTIEYTKWYCGHWHTDKQIDKMEFLFRTVTHLE